MLTPAHTLLTPTFPRTRSPLLFRACPKNPDFGKNFEACTDFPYPWIDEFFSWMFKQNVTGAHHHKRLPPRLFQAIPLNRHFFNHCGTAILPSFSLGFQLLGQALSRRDASGLGGVSPRSAGAAGVFNGGVDFL